MTQEEGQDQDQDEDQLPSQFAEEPMSPLTSQVAGGWWLHKTDHPIARNHSKSRL